MSGGNSRHDEEAVLYAFCVEPTHDRTTLEQYLRQYPEHALALIDCSIELMMDASRVDEEVLVSSDQAIDQAWLQFQEAMEPKENSTVTANPFSQLSPTTFKSMAKRLDVSNLFLMRVRERAIEAATIPRRFTQRLAAELGANTDAVWAYLCSPPTITPNQSFRSNVKPEAAAQISFEEAVETSHLTPSQKEALQALRD